MVVILGVAVVVVVEIRVEQEQEQVVVVVVEMQVEQEEQVVEADKIILDTEGNQFSILDIPWVVDTNGQPVEPDVQVDLDIDVR